MRYLALISLLPNAIAYSYSPSSDSMSTTPVAAAQKSTESSIPGIHVVKVGQAGLIFEPENMFVPVGDTVEFHFWPKAHSVAQSSFEAPCRPLNATSFFSGPIQIALGMSSTVFSITINDTNPIWYYCATSQHCQNGMSGVINPPPTVKSIYTINNYKLLATEAENNVAPTVVQGGTLGSQVSAGPSRSPSSSAPGGSAAPGKLTSKGGGLSTGAKAGIGVGVALGFLATLFLGFWLGRRRKVVVSKSSVVAELDA